MCTCLPPASVPEHPGSPTCLSSAPTKSDSPYPAQLSQPQAPDLPLYLVLYAAQATPDPSPLLLMAAESKWYHQPMLSRAPWAVPVPGDMTHHPCQEPEHPSPARAASSPGRQPPRLHSGRKAGPPRWLQCLGRRPALCTPPWQGC